jgi:hypothetical protein
MTPAQFQILQQIGPLVWGSVLSFLFFIIGLRLLLRKPPDPPKEKYGEPAPTEDPALTFYRTWRNLLLGLLCIVLGYAVAGGAQQVGNALDQLLCSLMAATVFIGGFAIVVRHIRQVPLVGQTYHIQGIGEVTVKVAQIHTRNPIPEVMVIDLSGHEHTIPVFQFQRQATLLADREVKAPEDEES